LQATSNGQSVALLGAPLLARRLLQTYHNYRNARFGDVSVRGSAAGVVALQDEKKRERI